MGVFTRSRSGRIAAARHIDVPDWNSTSRALGPVAGLSVSLLTALEFAHVSEPVGAERLF
jgi:hypothetical protein